MTNRCDSAPAMCKVVVGKREDTASPTMYQTPGARPGPNPPALRRWMSDARSLRSELSVFKLPVDAEVQAAVSCFLPIFFSQSLQEICPPQGKVLKELAFGEMI